MTHICVNNLTIIGPDNGLSPGRHQAIIWTNAGMLLIGPEKQTSMKFYSEFIHFHSRKSISKCRLEKGGHFVSASMCFKGNWRGLHPAMNTMVTPAWVRQIFNKNRNIVTTGWFIEIDKYNLSCDLYKTNMDPTLFPIWNSRTFQGLIKDKIIIFKHYCIIIWCIVNAFFCDK